MAYKLRVMSVLTHQFNKNFGSFKIDSARIQSVRCQSLVSQKLIYSDYGDVSKVVRQESEDLPDPKGNEVLIQMLAAPVNPADINTIQGVYPVKPKLPSIPGNEGVGKVISVGSDVTTLKEGDRVLPRGIAWGTWRTHALCDEKEVLKIPGQVGIVEAATITVNPCTAYRMLHDFVKLSKGDTVMQNGANSAAGQNVIQMCRAWGYNSVNIVRNRDKIDELKAFLTNLGATHVLTEEELRTTQLFKESKLPRPKLALNCVGGKNALDCLRHLDQKGVMVTYGGMSREPVTVPTSALIFKDLSFSGFWMTRWSKEHAGSNEQKKMMEDIIALYEGGQLKAPVHKLVPFNNYKEALENTMNPKGFSGVKYIFDFRNNVE